MGQRGIYGEGLRVLAGRIREILGLLARDPPEFCSEQNARVGAVRMFLRFLGLGNFAFPQHITCQPDIFGI